MAAEDAAGAGRAAAPAALGGARFLVAVAAALVLGGGQGAVAQVDAACGGEGVDILDFRNVIHNNLGGMGPDMTGPPSIEYRNVATVDGVCILLEVQVAAGSSYTPLNALENGMTQVNEQVGEINLQARTKVDLEARFLECESRQPARLSKLNFTLYGLGVPAGRLITVRGYWAYFLKNPALFEKTYTDYGTTFIDGAPCVAPLGAEECGLAYHFQDANHLSLTLETVGVGQPFFFGGALCRSTRLPMGHCSRALCGAGLRLRRPPPKCAGEVCTEDECCERPYDVCSARVCGAGYALKVADQLPALCRGEACLRGECCRVAAAPLPLVPAVQSCKGQERQWHVCENLPECHPCQRQDCMFSVWADWEAVGGCSGLCKRKRTTTANNECGSPCNGHTEETVARHEDPVCYPERCRVHNVDCQWAEWSEWTRCQKGCSQCMKGQSYRERRIAVKQLAGGKACDGSWNMTRPCQLSDALDCKMTDWGGWTTCSKSCGTGWKFRMRRVLQEAKWGGKPCGAEGDYGEGLATRQTHACNVEPCGTPEPCVLDTWTEWDGCNENSKWQKFRSREILMPALNGAGRCNHPLNETVGCAVAAAVRRPCDFSEWSGWSECTASCEGQAFRTRHITNPETCVLEGVRHSQSLRETQPCGAQVCWQDRCELAAWGPWSPCSAECGSGIATRSRQAADAGHLLGCSAGLAEVQACENRKCEVVDCKWDEWGHWDACTNSCGGGTKRRSRVVKAAPHNGGRQCSPGAKWEVTPCATQSCDVCIDAKWGKWSKWSGCSATCSPAFRSRHRDLETHANHCGKPALGAQDEYGLCDGLGPCEPEQDCEVSEWDEWSPCSASCSGVRERMRSVSTFASGHGKKCTDTSLKEVMPCHAAAGELAAAEGCGPHQQQSCHMGHWEDWSGCSRKCDGGQRSRSRHVLGPAANGGAPCGDTLAEIGACHTQPCKENECQDCVWGQWSDWSECTRCGSQRFRHRSIESLPNRCGRPCDEGAAKEAGSCWSPCQEKLFCSWSDWKPAGECGAICGETTRTRERHLYLAETDQGEGTFFVAESTRSCKGTQADVVVCHLAPCEPECQPVDCDFGDWGEWGACACSQLRERRRSIRTVSGCGGRPCQGNLLETEQCTRECKEPVDCEFSDWEDWRPKVCGDEGGQTTRIRRFKRQAENGGKPCDGVIQETAPCEDPEAASKNCALGEWRGWSTCTEKCGLGLRTRLRVIEKLAVAGGQQCVGALEEIDKCNEDPCWVELKDCTLAAWASWSSCEGLAMRFRIRAIAQQPSGGGMACIGTLKEAEECGSVVDCTVSEWTGWDECDKTCGGGQRTRAREVTRNPSNGGRPCPERLMETAGCNERPCETQDCTVSGWSSWSECSASCGLGFTTRSRSYKSRPCEDGRGCDENLEEVEPCVLRRCSCVNCVWGVWTEWGACSAPCDSGQRTRERHILKQPDPGCAPCEARDKEEVQGCNTQRCQAKACIDGEWENWQDWEACSASCKGGETWRSRAIKVEASDCGVPAVGLSREYKFCNLEVPCAASADCEFDDWSTWSTCSAKCEGLQRRHRAIKTPGRGTGLFCEGPTEENAPCQSMSGVEDFTEPGMYLDLTRLINNNLGSAGPSFAGEPTMRFSEVGTLEDGTAVDLVVSPRGAYMGCDVQTNGVQGRTFGSINVAAGSRATVEFRLVNAPTGQDVTPKEWTLKVFDLDTGAAGGAKESVHARSFADFHLSAGTTVLVEQELSELTKFEASRYGTDDDDPEDPTQATLAQEAKAVALHYLDTSAVQLILEVTPGAVCKTFMFASRACFFGNCTANPCQRDTQPSVDCKLGDWDEWGPCDAACGAGQQLRARSVVAEPAHGGQTCSDALSQTQRCEMEPCNLCSPIDCTWEDWGDWSACDKCGGQMLRFRHVASSAACGGKACKPGDTEQIANCTRSCTDRMYCEWAEWQPFGECSASCGNGLKSRARYLKAVSAPPASTREDSYLEDVFKKRRLIGTGEEAGREPGGAPGLERKFRELRLRGEQLRSTRLRALALASVAGCLTVAAALAVVSRGPCRRKVAPGSPRRALWTSRVSARTSPAEASVSVTARAASQ